MESQPKKAETKLKIIIYGDNIDNSLISKLYDNKKCKKEDISEEGFSYSQVQHNILDWKFLIVKKGNISNIISLMKKDHKTKYFHHVLLLFIENIEKQIEIIKQIQENGSVIYYPFIIFCSSIKKEKSDIIELIEKKELEIDYRILLYINRPFNPLEILNILWQKCCYYNQLGNSLTLPSFNKLEVQISQYLHSFNFFVIGKTGVGKSAFINVLCGDLVALERGGSNVTVGTKRFRCLNAPIYFYDTEGFSSGKELEKTKAKIFEIFDELKKMKQSIHGIFYIFNGQSKRTLDDKEEELINKLFEKGFDIYFLLNFMSENKVNKKSNRMKKILREENQFRFNNPEYNKLFEQNLFVVNIKNESFKCHGLEKVFEIICKKFENDKIDIEKVKKLKGDNNKIFPLLKDSSFFKNINSSSDVLEYIKSYCSYQIFAATVLSGLVGGFDFLPFSDLPIIYSIQLSMIIIIAFSFGFKLDKTEASNLLKTLGASAGTTISLGLFGYAFASILKLLFGLGSIIGGIINASVGASTTLAIGKLCVEYFTNILGETEIYTFLNSRAEACNKGINFFNEFKSKLQNSEDYSKIY